MLFPFLVFTASFALGAVKGASGRSLVSGVSGRSGAAPPLKSARGLVSGCWPAASGLAFFWLFFGLLSGIFPWSVDTVLAWVWPFFHWGPWHILASCLAFFWPFFGFFWATNRRGEQLFFCRKKAKKAKKRPNMRPKIHKKRPKKGHG